jgi:hypothetical protein
VFERTERAGGFEREAGKGGEAGGAEKECQVDRRARRLLLIRRPSSHSSARSVKSAVQVRRLRNSRRPSDRRYGPGSPDPGYRRVPFFRVDPCSSVVAPTRSGEETPRLYIPQRGPRRTAAATPKPASVGIFRVFRAFRGRSLFREFTQAAQISRHGFPLSRSFSPIPSYAPPLLLPLPAASRFPFAATGLHAEPGCIRQPCP